MSDVYEWGKGAVEDIWGGVTGQTNFKAKPYDPQQVHNAQAPWLQQLDTAARTYDEDQYEHALKQEANALNQEGVYDAMGRMVTGFDPNASAAKLEGTAGQYGSELARQAAGLEGLAGEVAGAPSYADEASRAAMDRASTEAIARAASARGPNAALAMRDAAGMSAGAARQAASEAAALKANEMNQRFQTRGDLLSRAANVTGSGGQLVGNLYGTAGDQRRAGMTAGVDAAGTIAGQRRSDMQARTDAQQAGANIANQAQQTRQSATQAGLTGATQGQGIIAGSHDAANAANAGVAQTNATNKKDAIGGLMTSAGGALLAMSDIRAKTDIEPLSTQQQDYLDVYQPDQRNLPKDWGPPSSAPVAAKDPQAAERKQMGMSMLMKGLSQLSDERTKTDIDPIVRMAVDPEANREALSPVKPYRFRYRADVAKAAGLDTEPRDGVMAQDLERSEAGEEVVNDGPGLKTLDNRRALGFTMAGVAGLDKRLQRLERAAGSRREGRG